MVPLQDDQSAGFQGALAHFERKKPWKEAHMGVERPVARWYARHQAILEEIARLEAILQQLQEGQESGNEPGQDSVGIAQQLLNAQERLRTLGPCPKPMMA